MRELRRANGMKIEKKTKENENAPLPPLILPFLYDQDKKP